MQKAQHNPSQGFTLAELLLALLTLAVIATFTIPKILQSTQNSQKLTRTKHAISAISEAYQSYIFKHGTHPGGSATAWGLSDIAEELNLVKTVIGDSSVIFDDGVFSGSGDCDSFECYFPPYGGLFYNASAAGAIHKNCNPALNVMEIGYDPDGVASDGSIVILLYANGRVTTTANMLAGSIRGSACGAASPLAEPSWFHW